jgi:RNA polymerase sigma factor (TIGR02999 family)
MGHDAGKDATVLLRAAGAGDATAAADLLPLVYTQLHELATARMAGERAGHTLQATALVSEAYLRLVGNQEIEWANRAHFFHAAAEAMRRILIEHARKKGAVKRGGDWSKAALNVADLAADENSGQVVALDEAFARLDMEDPRAAEVVRLRFYAGLSVDETAAATGLSRRTVLREWEYARAWLLEELRKDA